jgi:glycogen synthase
VQRLRVLTLGWEFPPRITGGLGVACFGLCEALAKQVDLTVLLPSHPPEIEFRDIKIHRASGDYQSFAQVREIPLILDPYAVGEIRAQSPADLYGSDLGAKVIEFSKIATELALRETFDIIHAHDWMTFLAGVEVKKHTGKPLVVHVHSLQHDRAGAGVHDWIYHLEKHGMHEADRIIPVSHYTGEIITRHYGISPAKIRPIHHGVAPVNAYQRKGKFPEKLILFLGRLTAQKGPEIFLQVAARVIAQHPSVRFVMAGAGEKRQALQEASTRLGLSGHLHFPGFLTREKVHELLAETAIYCMPSVSEPFGLSALEAAQFGIPSVISNQSGVAEVLKSALKADYWDIAQLATHIGDLLTDEHLYRRLATQATREIADLTWDAAAAQVLSVYHELTHRC